MLCSNLPLLTNQTYVQLFGGQASSYGYKMETNQIGLTSQIRSLNPVLVAERMGTIGHQKQRGAQQFNHAKALGEALGQMALTRNQIQPHRPPAQDAGRLVDLGQSSLSSRSLPVMP